MSKELSTAVKGACAAARAAIPWSRANKNDARLKRGAYAVALLADTQEEVFVSSGGSLESAVLAWLEQHGVHVF